MPGRITIAVLLTLAAPAAVPADDWPTFRHDNHRSGKTTQRIAADRLQQAWVWRSPAPPQPAWAGPAKWDAFAQLRGLRSMRDYDPVFHVIAVGDAVYFGSSADDSVHCLDAATGKQRWTFTTDGPVRIAPSCHRGRLYFGSDDGWAYCLRADDGKLVWKHRPAKDDRRVINNGRLISLWPCRTGVLVDENPGGENPGGENAGGENPGGENRADGGTAYFAAGMLPWKESFLCAVDAQTGKAEGPGRYVQQLSGVTMEGALLASRTRLFSPQGRVPPRVFDRAGGRSLGPLDGKSGGGCFALVTDDAHLLHGPGNKTGWITDSNADTRQKIATIGGGNQMVVAGDTAYLLTDHRLVALARSSGKTKWSKPCDCPYALILAGDVLLVGGRDKVAAFAAADGAPLFEGQLGGKAYGLAVANGQLLVSTDEGAIYAFRPAAKPTSKADDPPTRSTEKPQRPPAPVPPAPVPEIEDKDLLGRWVFQGNLVRDTTVKDLAGRLDGAIAGPVVLKRVDDYQALAADGSSNHILLAEDHKTAALPQKEISAEAWVRVDRPLTWGGIVGALQDNGSYERGWILGYNDRRFSFAVCGSGGPGNLTYLKADADFQPGQWAHVVGTYDGAQMKVYLNGRLAGTSDKQKGPIDYPPQAFYEIGAYHDQDEFFRLAGMIHEVRVYRRVLGAEEVRRHHEDKRLSSPPPPRPADTLTLAVGPYLQFTNPASAVVRWQTERPSPTILEYGRGPELRKIGDARPKTRHQAVLTGLRKDTVYRYAIKATVDGRRRATPDFECDTFFNYSPAAVPETPASAKLYPTPELRKGLREIGKLCLELCGVRQGICLMIGGHPLIAYELVRKSDLRVILVHTDAEAVESARRLLRRVGVYGTRVAVHHVDSFEQFPFTDNFASLILSHQQTGWNPEWYRLLKPDGGVLARSFEPAAAEQKLQFLKAAAALGMKTYEHPMGFDVRAVRGPLAGAGVWSHQYGLPDNSGYGGESLAGAGSADELDVQWIGRPGPRAQADRNGRKPSPLSAGGRLFMQGLHRIVAIDAYNGTILWSLEIPQFERFNVPRDCGNWCADRQHVFAAVGDKCWRIDADDGEVARFYDVTPGTNDQWQYDWGYVAREGDLLVGSAVKSGTSFTEFFGGAGAGWYDAKTGEVTKKVCSDNLFALGKASGRLRWKYAGGLIVNPTITIGDGRVYFVECRNPAAIAQDSRRIEGGDFWQDQFLVALDVRSGKPLWERPLEVAHGTVVFYLAYGGGKLVLLSSGSRYNVYAFNAADGSPAWDLQFDWPSDNHGKHMSRPAIAAGRVFVRPKVIDLATGKLLAATMPDGGCGTYALTDRTVTFRAGNVTIWDFTSNRTTSFPRLRPGCWLSTVPAGGMLLSPEAGGGCSCGNWLETSVGFTPRSIAK